MSETPKKQEVATVKDRAPTIKDWITGDKFREAVASSLPSHMTPDRFIRVALTAMMKTPKLAECTQASIFKVMLDLSSIGLEPDGRRAHIIPYGNIATLIIDYKGLIELAKRSGEVVNWRAEIVCENDKFAWENGVVTHKIDWRKPRGKMEAVYSHVLNKDGISDYEVMTMEQVEAIRRISKAGASGPWKDFFSEMAKKSVIRRHSKRVTISAEFVDALAKDGDTPDFIPTRVADACPPGMSRTEFVAKKLFKQTDPDNAELQVNQVNLEHLEYLTGISTALKESEKTFIQTKSKIETQSVEPIPPDGEPLESGSGG